MNRPWMPLYIADYLADTAHLNAAQSGAYMHLIMHYWQLGSLPDDEPALARIAKMTTSEWKKSRPVVAAFFHDGWHHKRIDLELGKAKDLSGKRREAAEQMHIKRNAIAQAHGYANAKAIAPANAEQLDTHARTCAGGLPSLPLPLSKKLRAPNGASVEPDPDADLFRRGKQVLGQNSGGLISDLKRSQDGNIAKTRAIIETASTKQNPRQYVGGVMKQKDEEKPYDPIF